MKKNLLLLYLLAWLTTGINAQTLRVSAPKTVEVGEQFRLQYTVNTDNAREFRVNGIPDALEVLFGPSTSSQSSWQMVNGHTSSSSSITYTYLLCANKKGSYTIPSAHVKVGGKVVSSQPVHITVSGNAARAQQNSGGRSQAAPQHQMREAGSAISANDLFIKVSANKTTVHEQEPVLLTYKVYTLVDITQLEGKMPDLTGFHSQEVKLPQQKSFHIESLNGRNYRCVTWSQYVMYPQMTGKLEIPSITFKGIVVQENRSVDPFEAFFNGGSGYVEVKKNIVAPGLSVNVLPLPQHPAGFSGGVGKFNISAQINKTEVTTGNPVNLRVVVGGIGNLKLIKQPVVNFPKGFDKYDAKVTDKTKLTANGVEGNMIYDYLAVPNNQGKYEIPPIEFTYYDTSANAYKTIKTQAFELNVEQGSGRRSAVDEFGDNADKDIHPIKQGKVKMRDANDFFFGSVGYFVTLVLLLVIFVVLLTLFRRRAVEHANIGKMRGKKANKIARKRLKKAAELLAKDRQGEFYDEVLRALWGYVGDKLNMHVEDLSRDNVSEKLAEKGVDEDTVKMFITALDECEFERYAPGDAHGNMSKTFAMAIDAIMKIENAMKTKKATNHVAHMILLIMMVFVSASANAITKANADNEYLKGNYQQAIKDYEDILKGGKVNADIYYNLGNAYYRMDNITHAVLNYERALQLSPGDKDIRFNLQMARSKTIDKIAPESEMFFVTWYRSLVSFTSVDGWAYTSLVCLIASLVLLLLYLFASPVALRKLGFYGGMVTIVLFLFSTLFAFQQKIQFDNRCGAIVIAPSVTVKSTPQQAGKDVFTIHEGTKVTITDNTMHDWCGIKLDDGREGWIQTSRIEII